MDKQEILSKIDDLFPPVKKPAGLNLSFHKTGCFECEYLRNDLVSISEDVFPESGLKKIYNEISCLSAEGFRWVMPTYLKHVMSTRSSIEDDEIEIEFFIYNLGPELKYQKDAIRRMRSFNKEQLEYITLVLKWLKSKEYWQEWYGQDLEKALKFVSTLNA